MAEEAAASWPDLVGKDPEEAKTAILATDAELEVIIMDENAPATMDLQPKRVRVLTGADGKVAHPPTVG